MNNVYRDREEVYLYYLIFLAEWSTFMKRGVHCKRVGVHHFYLAGHRRGRKSYI